MATAQLSRIVDMNDEFRRKGQGVTITSGVQEINDLVGLLQEVREFEVFTEENDPHGEHDFGSIEWGSEKVFWKIDYYNAGLCFWEDPLSPTCQRIMTVMLASEY
jgi:hypothetical protein